MAPGFTMVLAEAASLWAEAHIGVFWGGLCIQYLPMTHQVSVQEGNRRDIKTGNAITPGCHALWCVGSEGWCATPQLLCSVLVRLPWRSWLLLLSTGEWKAKVWIRGQGFLDSICPLVGIHHYHVLKCFQSAFIHNRGHKSTIFNLNSFCLKWSE